MPLASAARRVEADGVAFHFQEMPKPIGHSLGQIFRLLPGVIERRECERLMSDRGHGAPFYRLIEALDDPVSAWRFERIAHLAGAEAEHRDLRTQVENAAAGSVLMSSEEPESPLMDGVH